MASVSLAKVSAQEQTAGCRYGREETLLPGNVHQAAAHLAPRPNEARSLAGSDLRRMSK